MENENKETPVEQTNQASGETSKDQVAYETFQKVLSEKKNVQSKLSEYEAKLQALEEEKLQRDGKKDELLENYKKRASELEAKFNKTQQTYAWNTLTGEIKREAAASGCLNPDKLIKLMSEEDLNSIEVGENFSVNRETIKEVIERNKKENSFLFSQGNKVIANGIPNTNKPTASNGKNINNMSWDEAKELAKTLKN